MNSRASSAQLQICSPRSGLNSPEPSGTPDLKTLSSHRSSIGFGYPYGTVNAPRSLAREDHDWQCTISTDLVQLGAKYDSISNNARQMRSHQTSDLPYNQVVHQDYQRHSGRASTCHDLDQVPDMKPVPTREGLSDVRAGNGEFQGKAFFHSKFDDQQRTLKEGGFEENPMNKHQSQNKKAFSDRKMHIGDLLRLGLAPNLEHLKTETHENELESHPLPCEGDYALTPTHSYFQKSFLTQLPENEDCVSREFISDKKASQSLGSKYSSPRRIQQDTWNCGNNEPSPRKIDNMVLEENVKPALVEIGQSCDMATSLSIPDCDDVFIGKGSVRSSSIDSVHRPRSQLDEETVSGVLQGRFLDLVQKVKNLNTEDSLKVSLSAHSQPSNWKKIGSQSTLDLQTKVDHLKAQVAEERHQRKIIAQRLAEYRRESERSAQEKQEQWEIKFRELQKEKYALSIRLQELEMENPRQRIARGGELVQLTEEELRQLRQEIFEQESLIKGYQVENERAVEKLKEIQAEAKERELLMAEENASLASQLASMKVAGRQSFSGITSISLRESSAVKSELENALARENNLKIEVDKLRQEKHDLEKRILEVQETKLGDIVETNQTHSNNDTGETCLYEEFAVSETSEIQLQTQNIPSINFEVKNQVSSDAKDEDNHHHIKRNSVENKDISKDLKGNLHKLKHEKEIMKQEYEHHIKTLKQQLEKKSSMLATQQEKEQNAIKRIKELEQQVEELRVFYIKKVKELTEKLEAVNRQNMKLESTKDQYGDKKEIPSPTLKLRELKKAKKKVAMLENIIAQKDGELKILRQNIPSLKHETDDKQMLATNKIVGSHGHLDKTINVLDEVTTDTKIFAVDNVGIELRTSNLKGCLKPEQDENEVPSSAQEVQELRKQIKIAQMNCEVLKSACVEAMEKTASLKLQYAENESKHKMHELQEQSWKRKNDELEKENKALEARINSLLDEMKEMQEALNGTPHASQIHILQKKVGQMEARQNLREREWQKIIQETKRFCSLQEDMTERKWQLAIETKNAEIERFRLELDTILETALKIQETQIQEVYSDGSLSLD